MIYKVKLKTTRYRVKLQDCSLHVKLKAVLKVKV